MSAIPSEDHSDGTEEEVNDGSRVIEEPQGATSVQFLRDIVASYPGGEQPSARSNSERKTLRKRYWVPLAAILFGIAGYFILLQEQKSAWEAEQRTLKDLDRIPGLSFSFRQVLPESLFGHFGNRVVGVQYSPPIRFGIGSRGNFEVGINRESALSPEEVERIEKRFEYIGTGGDHSE